MNQIKTVNTGPGISIDDILFVIVRHKWKIGIISLLAIAAAVVTYELWPVPYRSEARLLIKYIVDEKNPSQMASGTSKVTSLDDRGETILNTEFEVLSSYDLALDVARSVGASNILAKAGGGNSDAAAAALIRRNMLLEASKRSSVIHIVMQHDDPAIVQLLLKSLIQEYYKKHLEIHRDVGQIGDFLNQQTDILHGRLVDTERSLQAAKTNAGIISLEDTKKLYSQEMARLQTEILDAESELAGRRASVAELQRLLHTKPIETNDTAAVTDANVSPEKKAEYKRVCTILETLAKRQSNLLVQFTPENSFVKEVANQIDTNEKLKEQLERENPGLAPVKIAGLHGGDSTRSSQPDLIGEAVKISGLESRIKTLNQQLDGIRTAAQKMYDYEGPISDLERKYRLQETQYNYFSMSLEQSHIDDALGASRVSNISEIQAPTPPGRDYSKPQKVSLALGIGGVVFAIALAFFIEFFVDRSIKRPVEIESHLGLPLFMSIPRLSLGKAARALKAPSSENGTNGHSNGSEVSVWSPQAVLRPFCEGLRDSLITFFEINNLTHKPKLVAVTSCSEGAGVSTIAAGLAASLSETGDGNVLLVNMKQSDGAVHQFSKGALACDLDDALTAEKRDQALVHDNLYVANESSNRDQLPVILPKRFKNLIPRLRASDYDYIIFDMPAVNQITPTQRLARFMDMVVMVVESGKTDRVLAKRVSSLLTATKSNVGVVLNKTPTNLPLRLQQGV